MVRLKRFKCKTQGRIKFPKLGFHQLELYILTSKRKFKTSKNSIVPWFLLYARRSAIHHSWGNSPPNRRHTHPNPPVPTDAATESPLRCCPRHANPNPHSSQTSYKSHNKIKPNHHLHHSNNQNPKSKSLWNVKDPSQSWALATSNLFNPTTWRPNFFTMT